MYFLKSGVEVGSETLLYADVVKIHDYGDEHEPHINVEAYFPVTSLMHSNA